jgi:hypothetical protein
VIAVIGDIELSTLFICKNQGRPVQPCFRSLNYSKRRSITVRISCMDGYQWGLVSRSSSRTALCRIDSVARHENDIPL